MMQLCKELLGARNNVTNDSLSPQEWYNALDIRQEIIQLKNLSCQRQVGGG